MPSSLRPPTYAVVQMGNRMHYAVPLQLHRAGRLERLFTDATAHVGVLRHLRLLPASLRPAAVRRLLGRRPAGLPPDRVAAFTRLGLEAVWRQGRARTAEEGHAASLSVNPRFGQAVVAHGLGEAGAAYTFNSAALEVLQEARATGRFGVVEQTIAPYAVHLKEVAREIRTFGAWTEDEAAWGPAQRAFVARVEAEWDTADCIVCGSEYVRAGVEQVGGPVEKCVVVPYGIPMKAFRVPERRDRTGPLRVLTVGQVNLRKGAPYVAEAARRLRSSATFRMVGPVGLTLQGVRQLSEAGVELTGQVPRTDIAAHFAWADVFYLPSLCEGSATVTYEALAAGLPVVCTPNTGSIVRDGVEGYIVEARDPEQAEARLRDLMDPDRREALSRAAIERAAYGSTEAYGERLIETLDRFRDRVWSRRAGSRPTEPAPGTG